MGNQLLYKDEVYAIQGAIFEVYKEMGNAWHEEVYQQCMERELGGKGHPFRLEKNFANLLQGEGDRKDL